MTLYDILGVLRETTTEEIRTAYRRLSKTAHPDTGGSVESFETLKTAHDVLSDPDRRAFYDQTGTVKPLSADNELAEILSVLTGAFDEACLSAMQSGDDLTKTDLVARMRVALDKRTTELFAGCAESEKAAAMLEPLLGRFSTTDGSPNRIEMLIRDKQRATQAIGERMRVDIERIAKARTFLAAYRYRSDAIPMRPGSQFIAPGMWLAEDWQKELFNAQKSRR